MRVQVSSFPLSAMFGMCTFFLLVCVLCQRRLDNLVYPPPHLHEFFLVCTSLYAGARLSDHDACVSGKKEILLSPMMCGCIRGGTIHSTHPSKRFPSGAGLHEHLRWESLLQGGVHHALLQADCPFDSLLESKSLLQGWLLIGVYSVLYFFISRW